MVTGEPFNYSGKLAFLRKVCCDPGLRRTDVAVMSVLVDYANVTTGVAFPSIATIVAESGVPKTTTIRALRRLEDAHWLTANKRNGANSTYTLTGSGTGAGSDTGTGAIWNQTGAIQNLRVGKTGSDTGAEAVPTPEPEQKKAKATGRTEAADADASRPADLWADGIALLTAAGTTREQAGATIGKLRKEVGEDEAVRVVTQMLATRPTGPRAYIYGAIANKSKSVGVGRLPKDTRNESDIVSANEAALSRLGAPA